MKIEFTEEELIFVLDCISSQVNGSTRSLSDTMEYLSNHHDAFYFLQGVFRRDFDSIETGVNLSLQLIEGLKDRDDYEEHRAVLLAKQKQNQEYKQAFREVCDSIGNEKSSG
jgi:hypothetical protein